MQDLHFNSHAHVERDTFVGAQCPLEINFNSHAHVERDRLTRPMNSVTIISTHTLTWSVTVVWYVYPPHTLHFNSHAHVERDDFYAYFNILGHNFNSHAHVERDHFS